MSRFLFTSVSKFDKGTLGHYHTLTKLVNDKQFFFKCCPSPNRNITD